MTSTFFISQYVVLILVNDPCIDINQANSDGETPLEIALSLEDAAVVAFLLSDPRTETNESTSEGENLLMTALSFP